MTDDELENKLVPLQAQDLMFTLDKLKDLHKTSRLFLSMDLNYIGLFGHSIGARVLADVVHAHPTDFEAAVTLDIGIDESGKSLKFTIPFMHAIAADRKLLPPGADLPPVIFELGKNGYLVGFSPNEDSHNYSSHDNFSDLSTLQNLPAYQTLLTHLKKRFEEGYNLELKSHDPTTIESDKFDKTTYVLIKKDNKWYFSVYENKEKTKDIDVTMVAGLSETLAKLPNKIPEQLSDLEIESIKHVMTDLHYILFGKTFLGSGDGWMITNDINNYLVQFFNTYLKGKINPAFDNCSVLSKNTYIKCGPGLA